MRWTIHLVLFFLAFASACGNGTETPTVGSSTSTPTEDSRFGHLTDPSSVIGDCALVDQDDGGVLPKLWKCPAGSGCTVLGVAHIQGNTCLGSLCPVCLKDDAQIVCDSLNRTPTYNFNYPQTIDCIVKQ